MQRSAIVSAVLVLTACSAGEPEVAEPEEVAVSDFVTANGSPPGVYEFTGGDGSSSIITINADGTFSQMTPEGTHGAEGFLEVMDGRTCARLETRGAEPLCYTETAPAADGSFTTTPDGGEPIAVRPLTNAEVSALEVGTQAAE
ncbi:hypothetical protein [Erythrobacter alti]|uniref:hypothetical protein n=1 Tax=Erythrobacter alti TaxID=1896145 RepID=UPI0030F400B9